VADDFPARDERRDHAEQGRLEIGMKKLTTSA
jgi:hypothetical protein